MNPKSLITVLTDFGLDDWFVGVMKGVILRLQPRLCIVDLTHHIAPGDVPGGAFALAAAYQFFPRGTIHLAVVDPGVGGARPAIVVETDDYFFIGPDNGLLSFALRREQIRRIHRLENPRYFLDAISQTFHGRDIFAPVAAHLSCGVPCQRFGARQRDFQRLPWREPRMHRGAVHGEIIYVDRFGNAISNLANKLALAGKFTVRIGNGFQCKVGSHYQSVSKGKAVAVPGSSGFLEVAVNGGSAASVLGLKSGSKFTLESVKP